MSAMVRLIALSDLSVFARALGAQVAETPLPRGYVKALSPVMA